MQNNYLIECNDSISIEKKISEIINKNNFTDCYKSTYDLEETLLDNALEDLDTYSFLSDKKIIIIKNCFCENNEKKLDHLLKYLDNYNPSNLLILVTKKMDNRLNVVKKIKKCSNIEIVHLELNALDYAKSILSDYRIDNSAINLLVELCKNDITRIDSECNKLMLYKLNEKEITRDDVSDLVIKKIGDSNDILFSLIKYIILKDKKNAFKTYKELSEYNIDSNSIIGLMASQMRLTHQVKLLSENNLTNVEIANELGLKTPYQVKKIKEYIYNYTYDEIYDFIHKLADMDLSIKSGKIDSSLAIDMLLINL